MLRHRMLLSPTHPLSTSFSFRFFFKWVFFLIFLQHFNSVQQTVVSSKTPSKVSNRWTVTVPHILYLPFPPPHLSSQDTTHFLTMWQSTKHFPPPPPLSPTANLPPSFLLSLTHVEQHNVMLCGVTQPLKCKAALFTTHSLQMHWECQDH